MELSSEIREQWDQTQLRLGGSFLQGSAWAEFQTALGREVVWNAGAGVRDVPWAAQSVLIQESGFRFLHCAQGPTLSSSHQVKQVFKIWRQPGHKITTNLDFVRIEPQGAVTAEELQKEGAIPTIELNPAHTVIVDLSLSEDELRHNLSSGHRNAINGAERRGLSFRIGQPEEIEVLISLIKQTGRRKGFSPHPDHYYRKMAEVLMPLGAAKLYIAEAEGKPVAASIVFDYNGQRIYAHAAADPAARKLQAAVPLVWHMMMEAKAAGMTSFDLWGVAPADAGAEHPWAGFSQFKRAFGGREVERVGTWDLPLKPLKYRAYLAARVVNRWVRR
jgi:lipid II:glycine glycyltransferase (peptidoglycan interpeptide bridge formation enzyme)